MENWFLKPTVSYLIAYIINMIKTVGQNLGGKKNLLV